ncbi:hypothetical protein [Bradyrhizobium sp. OAE829]|uniref:hypothetical protein n=1 Tax=Bradyrhizobium sp. OAE829 TaxID=2663807 RepID=UPI00178994B9
MDDERKSSKEGQRAAEGLREAPMEKAQKKNRNGEPYSMPGVAFPCEFPCKPSGPIIAKVMARAWHRAKALAEVRFT